LFHIPPYLQIIYDLDIIIAIRDAPEKVFP